MVKKQPEQVIVEATGAATAVAEDLAQERRAKDAERKRKARAQERQERVATGSTAASKYPKPEQFKDHPFAQGLNEFADKVAGLSGSGAAEKCNLGQAWMAVADYYFGDPINHPLALAATATASFAVVAWTLKQQQAAKGPGSPAGTGEVPLATAMDAPCGKCGQPFPDVGLMLAHVAEAHREAA